MRAQLLNDPSRGFGGRDTVGCGFTRRIFWWETFDKLCPGRTLISYFMLLIPEGAFSRAGHSIITMHCIVLLLLLLICVHFVAVVVVISVCLWMRGCLWTIYWGNYLRKVLTGNVTKFLNFIHQFNKWQFFRTSKWVISAVECNYDIVVSEEIKQVFWSFEFLFINKEHNFKIISSCSWF